ncbi:MAG: hypothetical protein ABW061_17900 [Polyangiaceae bacterium]
MTSIQDLRTPSAARLEAERRLTDAQTQCAAAAQKLEAAKAACEEDASLANIKARSKAAHDLEPFTDFLAERTKQAKAALALDHEAKRALVPGVHRARLVALQARVAPHIAAVADLYAATSKALSELEAIANEFDAETAELAQVAREIGATLPDNGARYYWGTVVPRPSNAHDVIHSLLPEAGTVLGLPLSALQASSGGAVDLAKQVAGFTASRRADLQLLKGTLPT